MASTQPNKKRAAKRAKKQGTTEQQSNTQTIDLARVKLTGTLKTTSPLHIGTGTLTSLQDSAENSMPVLQIMRDHKNSPYIPGSSLRGFIRSKAVQCLKALEEQQALDFSFKLDRIVGKAKSEKHSTDAAQMGMLTVLDATILEQASGEEAPLDNPSEEDASSDPKRPPRPRVSIDPKTNTAKAGHLFALDTIPEGTEFAVTIELESVGKEELTISDMAIIANLLTDLSEQKDLLLGKGKSIGQGSLTWTPDKERSVAAIRKKDVIQWISGTSDKVHFMDLWRHENLPSRNSNKKNNKQQKQSELSYQSNWLTIPLMVLPQSAFLINANLEKSKLGDKQPAATFQTNREGHAEIPGSSLKGLFRAHCRKILTTLEQDEDKVDQLINAMFGSTNQASAVRISSALSTEKISDDGDTDSKNKTVVQYFNAIDRFTGGVKDGALYHVKAAYCEQLNGGLQLNEEFFKQYPWAQALLIMLMRDAMEGDLSVGWGKSKGFGQTRLEWKLPNPNTDETVLITSWQELYDNWSTVGLLGDTNFERLPELLQQAIDIELAKEDNR